MGIKLTAKKTGLTGLLTVILGATGFANDATIITPSWETQKQARMYQLGIPAPRGMITDRYGVPLAQTRVGYNLAVRFPTPLNFKDPEVIGYARQKIAQAEQILQRPIPIEDSAIISYYRNRGLLPMEIALDLSVEARERLQNNPVKGLELRSVYLRTYPEGELAAAVLGYVGRRGRNPTGPIQNNDLLWTDFEGREGLELTFDSQLLGSNGQMNLTFDQIGNQTAEVIVVPPIAGNNVVTTLDASIQKKAERILKENAERGAIVVMSPKNGDILALASWPEYNPNDFVPFISSEKFKELQDDPDIPLLPRAFRSAYPAGSVYKIITGLAALESGAITLQDYFECPTTFSLGRLTFRNWKKEHAGSLNFVEAFIQSCNTWFYQVGIKTGKQPIIDWSHHLGFAQRTGIPLRAEAEGRIPTDEYMRANYQRPIMDGDVANMSIGQGDILVSPLQMAQAMTIIANGGTLYQARLVSQVQSPRNDIITAYNVRARASLQISPENLAALHQAMVGVVSSRSGTAGRASVKNVQVAGKTGTAQWGPKSKERIAAWFVGFAPAENPEFAFAAVYEGNPNNHHIHGGSHAAPLIGKLLNEVYTERAEREKAEKARSDQEIKAAQEAADAALEAGEIPRAIPVGKNAEPSEATQQEPDQSN